MTLALLLLDLQNEMIDPAGKIGGMGLAKVAAERGVVDKAARVLGRARTAGVAVAHVRLGFQPGHIDALSQAPRIAALKNNSAALLGTWGCEFPEAVAPKDGELIVTKQCVNPFFNTGLLGWLQARGVDHVALAGTATHLVVESAARAADDAGLKVTVLEDCCAAPDAEIHSFVTSRILPAFGAVIQSDALEL